ncbi:MAG: dihydrodipicolinate synthase family protein [Clostridia bacterium]|nr:dihydrodipicolinate synthase family protein [Clostridia bacterium]
MMKNISDGVYPTMITPFHDDGTIDLPAAGKLLDYYARSGAKGVFAICQSSEIFKLSFEEMYSLLAFIMENRPEGLEVIASGNTSDDPDTIVERAKSFISLGIDGYVFITNRFASEDEGDDVFLERIFRAVDRIGSDVPFGLYECPYPYKRVVSPYCMKKLGESGRFAFLKDTCCDIDLIGEKIEACRGTPLKLYNANSATLLDSLRLGAAGYSGVMANFHTELYSLLCGVWDKDPALAEKLSAFVGFASVAECQCYPVNAKYYMDLCGVSMGTYTRVRDRSELTKSRMQEMRQLRELTDFFKQQLGICL